jgi:asparagine synthase (glutamine-hydrolysing)
MILFIGEISLVGLAVSSTPPTEPVKSGVWKTIPNTNPQIHACDFSRKKDSFLELGQLSLAVSGQPVIGETRPEKSEQIAYIANALTNSNTQALGNANGVFCGFMHDRNTGAVRLFTDYLGFRQIYIYRTKERLVFSNANWLINSYLKTEKLTLDIEGVVELGTLGYPLANRTQFKEVQLLPPAEVMTITPEGQVRTEQYFDITSTKQTTITEGEALEELHSIWKIAVHDRCAGTQKAFGFLSGGMDSRLLIHTLKTFNIESFTANFAPLETRDRVFGEMAAKSMQVHHFQHPSGSMLSDVLTETVEAWLVQDNAHAFFVDSPFIWSGDGGSVGMGHVYLTDEISDLASKQKFNECADLWCDENNRIIPTKLYQDPNTKEKFRQRIADLIGVYGAKNPDRAPYYYLLLNDQRRHLDKHYEIFHRREFDLQLPFFDKRLIQFISSLPSKLVNYHRIYDKLYKKISGDLTSTPWQTYPNHVSCPLPAPANLKYQWSSSFHSKKEKRIRAKENAIYCLRKVASGEFPGEIFNRSYLLITALTTLVNLSDHSYCRDYIQHGFRSISD